jgi:hypothetical protein
MGWTYLPCNSTGQRTGAAQRENNSNELKGKKGLGYFRMRLQWEDSIEAKTPPSSHQIHCSVGQPSPTAPHSSPPFPLW